LDASITSLRCSIVAEQPEEWPGLTKLVYWVAGAAIIVPVAISAGHLITFPDFA
jgi:hypothetical protein